jgi:hypothetical protein
MATSAIALGQLARLAFTTEAPPYGTPENDGYRYAYYYKSNLRETKPIEADPIIGSGLNNFRDNGDVAPTLSEHGGSLELPLCLNQIGDWLRLVFGAPSTSGATNYTHVFSSGALTLPTATIELNPTTNDFRQHVGCAVRSMKLDLADAAGYQRVMLDMLGYGENMLGSTYIVGTPTAAKTYDPQGATLAEVLLGGAAVGVLLSASLTYETGLIQDRYIDGSAKFGGAVLAEQAQFFGDLRVRYTGPTLDAAALAGTSQALQIRFVKGANNSISFDAPSCILGRAGVAIEGPGGIEQTLPFRCKQTSGAAMLAVTLKNQIATYPA